MDKNTITSTRTIIDEAEIGARIEELEELLAEGTIDIAQRDELIKLHNLTAQLSGIKSDEYFVPNLYRADIPVPAGLCFDWRCVTFDGADYLAISTSED